MKQIGFLVLLLLLVHPSAEASRRHKRHSRHAKAQESLPAMISVGPLLRKTSRIQFIFYSSGDENIQLVALTKAAKVKQFTAAMLISEAKQTCLVRQASIIFYQSAGRFQIGELFDGELVRFGSDQAHTYALDEGAKKVIMDLQGTLKIPIQHVARKGG